MVLDTRSDLPVLGIVLDLPIALGWLILLKLVRVESTWRICYQVALFIVLRLSCALGVTGAVTCTLT
jgi:hypothetical protein